MQKRKQKARVLIQAAILCYVIAALSVFLLPFTASENDSLTPAGMTIGILFWAGLVTGTFLYILAWRQVKDTQEYQKMKAATKPGCISFGKTRPAMVTDILFLPGLIITIAGTFVVLIPDVLMMIGMCLTLLTFLLHFVLNGRVYRYVVTKKRSVRAGQISEDTVRESTAASEQENRSPGDKEGV